VSKLCFEPIQRQCNKTERKVHQGTLSLGQFHRERAHGAAIERTHFAVFSETIEILDKPIATAGSLAFDIAECLLEFLGAAVDDVGKYLFL